MESRSLFPASTGGAVRLQTLVLVRWLAVFGQALTILLVHFGFEFDLPLVPSLWVVAASAVLNIALFVFYPASARLGDTGAAAFFAFDLVQLSLLLYLTGGLGNPFYVLILVPVTISATILSLRSTVLLGILALTCATLLIFVHEPLPWSDEGLVLPEIYVFGDWVALVLGMAFLGIYAWRVAAEARRMSDALAATQSALAREQQLSALGALAAAAAHELGTPLGTISLVAKELTNELPPDSPLGQDAALLLQQARRCRDILARFARRPEAEEGGEAFAFPLLTALVEAAMAPHQRAGVKIVLNVQPGEGHPIVRRNPAIIHGLGNLIENAVDFAKSKVEVAISWTDRDIRIDVQDDGPGFNVDILSALGDPYTTSRREAGGMGLGVFIAKTLLEQTGARVDFANRLSGGAGVAILWPRAILERAGDAKTASIG